MEITMRPAEERDFAFSFRVKREALGPHVAVRWGWDEEFQLELHRRRWVERPWLVVVGAANPLGTVSIDYGQDQIRFGEFYLLPNFQRKGIGSKVLQMVLAEADALGLPIILEHLKWNPVGSLYRRHGFVVTGESDTHEFLARQPMKADALFARSPGEYRR